MAKAPSFEDVLADPKKLNKLSNVQLHEFLKKLKELGRGMGASIKDLPPTPEDFAIKYSRGEWRSADHLRFLSNKLVEMEDRKLKRLLVSMPPRHGKSWLIDWYFPAWWLARHPKDRVILAGYGEAFARQWGAKVRDLIIEYSNEFNLAIAKDRSAADDWELTSGGGMICVGVGGSLTGRGANLMIIDDPIKNEEEANSEVYRSRMWEWWQSTAFTRLEPNAVVVVVATRWHQDDLIGRIVANDEKGEWTVLNIPALAMKDDALGRLEGAPLWPSRFEDDPDYENRKNSMSPYWWSAMFQGTPTPEGGGELLRDWWRFYVTQPEEFDQMCQTWDFSLKDNESSDYTVGLLLARKGASIYVLDRVRGHFSLQQAQGHIKRWATLFPQARAKLIEDTAMGPAIKQTLQHEIGGIIPMPAKGSKVSRVKAVAPYVQAGNVLLPENESGSKPKWVWEFIEECAAFPKGTNDDQVDAFTQGVTFLTPGGWRDLKNAAREAEANQPIDMLKQQNEWFRKQVEKWKKKADRKFSTKPLTKLGTRLN